MFANFQTKYIDFFRLEKTDNTFMNQKVRKYYTWKDPCYRDFMIKLLTNLEPFHFKKKSIILEELEEINEIKFICKGKVVVGFEINK